MNDVRDVEIRLITAVYDRPSKVNYTAEIHTNKRVVQGYFRDA